MTRQASSFRLVSTLLLAGATLVLPSPAGHAVPRIPATCGPSWSVESSPNFRGDHSNLQAVSAVSPTDVWAVGNHFLDFMHPFKTLAEHWDGNTWTIVPTPNRGSGGNFLFGVDALSGADAWAVGQSRNSDGITFTLIERWDGNAWTIVPGPNQGGVESSLNGVTAISPTDVWAVGHSRSPDFSSSKTLIEHWNGSTWSVVRSPSPGGVDNYLMGVAGVSTNDVWAVGYFDASGSDRPLIEHWNGTKWKLASAPATPPGTFASLQGVGVVAADDLWAVGNVGAQPLADHWDGSNWGDTLVLRVGDLSRLLSVSAISPTEVLAAGDSRRPSAKFRTLIERWDGSSWSVMKTEDPTSDDQLSGISALPSGYAWAVGSAHHPKTGRSTTLVEAICP